jgi:D-serine deaminase-like pyridoxal phosphate-dependent protein
MNEKKNSWYLINNIKENIRVLKSMVDDIQRLRPHVKTHKTKEATLLLMEAGINKFKCATIAEAEMLGMCNAKDVLLAYQPIGPKLKRFVDVIKKYPATKYSCLVDNINAATEMSFVFAENNLTVPVYIDLNVGQNRTGIEPGEDAVQLYIYCSSLKRIKPIGLHAYDGHIRDVDFNIRIQKCDEAFSLVEKMQQEIKLKGFDEPVIIAGGSPTFSIHSKRKNIECSPGTFIFWDKGYTDLCPEQNFVTAALVITRIISLPDKTRLCLDLGHKSVAAENEISKRVYFLNTPGLKAISQSEEHLVVEAGENYSYKVGDILYGLPIHICPTIALYERALIVENNFANGEWKIIARDRKITI